MHIKTILADSTVKTVFPIVTCPECAWPIQDYTAEKVLTKEEMEGLWHWAKVLQEVPTPNSSTAQSGRVVPGSSYLLSGAPAAFAGQYVLHVKGRFASAAKCRGMKVGLFSLNHLPPLFTLGIFNL
ncbi:hypothetical protein FRC00_000723 [Tulasnella sp. 408]|nr:hypothetical protein FRC00_000723 [Tulasnella sp. 408]